MRLFVRIAAGIAIALAALFGIVAAIVATIDTRTLIAPLEAELERATGRDVTLGPKARIDLSLAPTLELNDVTLANASWGSAKEMIRAKRVEAQVALLPLLSRRVDVVRFTLVEPAILLETDGEGRNNWTFGDSAAGARPADPVGDAAGAFGLGELAVDKGEVRLRDGRTGEVTAIRIDRLYLRARDRGKPVVAEFKGAIGEMPLTLEGHFGPLAALRAKQWPWPISVKGDVDGRKTEATAKLREVPDGLEASELVIASGSTRLRGTLIYTPGPARALVKFHLEADALVPADLAFAGGGAALASGAGKRSPVPPARPDGRLFPATPLPLAALKSVDAAGELAIGKLVLGAGRTLEDVRATVNLADGRLEIPAFRASALGGNAQGRFTLDARALRSPAMALRLDARDLDLAAVMALAGVKRDVKGGRVELSVDVNARGDSLRDWAGSLSGTALAKAGAARWASSNTGLPPAFAQLLDAVNPPRAGGTTELACAVIRLPFAGGVARVDRSIGIETDRIGVSASGTVDLRNETLDLKLAPRVKGGGSFDLSQLAGAVRVRGPLTTPAIAVDPAGSAVAAAQLGALARGGRAAMIAGVLAPAPSSPGSECAIALGGGRAAPSPGGPSAASGREPAPKPEEAVGRALGRLLGR